MLFSWCDFTNWFNDKYSILLYEIVVSVSSLFFMLSDIKKDIDNTISNNLYKILVSKFLGIEYGYRLHNLREFVRLLTFKKLLFGWEVYWWVQSNSSS